MAEKRICSKCQCMRFGAVEYDNSNCLTQQPKLITIQKHIALIENGFSLLNSTKPNSIRFYNGEMWRKKTEQVKIAKGLNCVQIGFQQETQFIVDWIQSLIRSNMLSKRCVCACCSSSYETGTLFFRLNQSRLEGWMLKHRS